ncbi:MAG: DNA polymerase III subunit alpha [Alphaproteobacteria bacterium]|nr:DNA polymerase III subunit alpha [Alphaproteobacteria bacterium]
MAHADFVHLRVHSAYSLLEGAIKIPELVELCRRYEMPALAVTDTRNLFGALEFSSAMLKAGVQPIIGCELAISRESADSVPPRGANGGSLRRAEPDKLVLLVKDEAGYANLLELVSKAHLETEAGETPQVPLSLLEGRADGLIALTAGPEGTLGRHLSENRPDEAEEVLAHLKALFPGNLYIEVMRHGRAEEDRIEGAMIDLAYAHDLPLVATNEAFFADAEMFEAHDALLAIAAGAHVSDPDRRRLNAEYRFRTPAEMKALFADLPEAVANTLVIARRCAFASPERAPILPPFGDGAISAAEQLRAQAREGLEARLEAAVWTEDMDAAAREAAAQPYRERLDFELGVIESMGFPGYFLIVADFICWAKDHGIPVGPGRGSGAGSVVAWSLTITDLDPLRFSLLFERFLNPERISMPDFDIDFCQDRRDEVIAYVQDRYGTDKVAQIITFGKLQARAVLRDVGRVLGMPYGQVDRICKLVPNNPANPVTLAQAIEGEPLLQSMRAEDETVGKLMDIALKLEGLYRHVSTHAAGVVIGDRPLAQLVPLYRDPRSDMPVTQFSMKYVEAAGLVKFDFLGLKTLTVLAEALKLVNARRKGAGEAELALDSLPLDDAPTYQMMARGETTGVFQLESSGMRDVLRNLRPDCFEDIIALVALYRPGPMDNIPRYIACKHGREEPDYLHPTLEDILKETFGVMIYQEQVMQIAQVLSGYSLGGADILRRAMGKKIKSEMDEQRQTFIDGAVERGVAKRTAGHIFDQVDKFAGYGFNKSHAAAYALIAYQTAWFKANYPVEFMAASMTLDMGNTDKLNVFRQELDRVGIKLLPPDVNASFARFSVELLDDGNRAIRYALGAVKGVGAAAMDQLVAQREAGGPFPDLFAFAERCDQKVVSKRQMESLVCAGAFDALNENRAQTLTAVGELTRRAQAAASERASGQGSLFGGDAPEQAAGPRLPEERPWPAMERLRREFEAIGFYLSAHPLDAYGSRLERLHVVRAADLMSRVGPGGEDKRFRLAGTVISKKERTSARGSRFAFVQMSDPSGMYEITVFSEVLGRARELLDAGGNVLVSADVRREGEGLRLTAQGIEPLDDAIAHAAPGLKVTVGSAEALTPLREALAASQGGRGEVSLILNTAPGREVEVAVKGRFSVSPAVLMDLRSVPGISEVREI